MRLIEPNEVANLSHGPIPFHAGIIMDGSGRWASYQDLERTEGHYATRRPILDSIKVALDLKISWLTLFAFSTENWTRPATELDTLTRYLADWAVSRELVDPLVRRGVRFHFIGDLNDSRIPATTSMHFHDLAELTTDNCALELVIAYNYGGQSEIVEAARKAIKAGIAPDELDVETFTSFMHLPTMPPIDLLIRTSGEQRLSNFMLWRLGYSELVFMDTLWPDFRSGHFQSAVAEYQSRYRRYGSLPWKKTTGEDLSDTTARGGTWSMPAISVLSADTVPAVPFGRKASRLSELLRAGYPAVDGFVISSDEHLRHLSNAGLGQTASRDAVRRSTLSAELRNELLTRVSGTGKLFAVRSSALAEDGDRHSLAGLYHSLLNVQSGDLPAAVLEVWASAHPETDSGQSHFSPMAVLIQPMLAGNSFGVVSSVDPLTGSSSAVVEVGTEPFAVTSGQRRVADFRVDISLTVTPVPEKTSFVSSGVILTAARLAWDVRDFYGQDVELEFGCQDDAVFILQARQVVTDPVACQAVPNSLRGTWVLDPVHYPRPLTPLFESIFAPLVRAASSAVFSQYGVLIRRIELRTIEGWPYIQAVPLTGHYVPVLPGPLIGFIARAHPALRERTRASAAAFATDLMSQHAGHWTETVCPRAITFIERISDADLTCTGQSALIQYLHDALDQLEKVVYSNFQTDFAYLIPLADFADHMRQRHGWNDQRSLQAVHGGTEPNGSYATALKNLAACLQARPDLAEKLHGSGGEYIARLPADDPAGQAWRAHARRWGLLLLGYDLDEPTVRELPDMEGIALTAFLDRQRVAHADAPGVPRDTLIVGESEMLSQARKWYPLREEGESVKATLLGAVRALAIELGRRLESAGQLRRASQVMYLTIRELLDACAGTGAVPEQVIDLRVQARETAAARVPRPELGKRATRNPDLRWLPAPSRRVHKAITLLARNEILAGVRSDRDQLVGRPASPGIRSGRVRIITEPGELQYLMPGDVIVAPTASSAWSSAFLTAGALVTDAGGLLSHAAIVARELNMPAVVGVDHATTRLETGDWITVDGNSGTVSRRRPSE